MKRESATGDDDHRSSNFISPIIENQELILSQTKVKNDADERDEKISQFIDLIEKYSRSIKRRLYNGEDIEDVKQDTILKILKCFERDSVWFKKIDNEKGYVWTIMLYTAIDFNKKRILQQKHDSIDDENDLALPNKLSDKGNFQNRLNNELDMEICHSVMKEMTQGFSYYEMELVELIYLGYKPKELSKILGKDYPNKSKADFSTDWNAIKAKLRFRLKKHLEGLT